MTLRDPHLARDRFGRYPGTPLYEVTRICGETQDVTCGSGMWDVGTCWRPVRHDGDCDFQVNAPGEA